jgi:CDP-glucose 4,6-dehydratase
VEFRAPGLEGVVSVGEAYRDRRVLVTGHTGFKGSWLTLRLLDLGARVSGLALSPGEPALFTDARIEELCDHRIGDVRDAGVVRRVVQDIRPDIVFHLAAQALVRRAYAWPLETFSTNVLGTANVLEAIRLLDPACPTVVVTSDKCYARSTDARSEEDPLGGDEPYGASKAAAEVVVAAYRRSYRIAVASARAGNVIGGGDWAEDRIIPDIVRALLAGRPVPVRNPGHIRPWQHVLEPVDGYLELGARLLSTDESDHVLASQAWNFGPRDGDVHGVHELVERFLAAWGAGTWTHAAEQDPPKEAESLRLSTAKARSKLGWAARWGFTETVARTAEWYRVHADGARGAMLRDLCRQQIAEHASTTVAA